MRGQHFFQGNQKMQTVTNSVASTTADPVSEPPWVRWRLAGLGSGGLACLGGRPVCRLEVRRLHVVARRVEPLRVPPVEVASLDLLDAPPRAVAVDELGLVQPV